MDPLRALALAGILLNHLVEAFGPGPWFTNPGLPRPPLADRLYDFVPHNHSPLIATVRILGWLGDAAPGVFILLSGLGLTLSALRQADRFTPREFYRRRLLRIFPLYIALHFVVLGAAVLMPGDQPSFASWRTLASLAGLRLEPGLFTYIAPAWWFVWLMLQLYAVYPLLWHALRRFGPARFFAGCVVLTLLARAAVLAANVHVFASMTGMIFETRLAEFAAGMVLADAIVRNRTRLTPARVAVPELTLVAALTYVAGLAASMVTIGTLVSNLLVTVGMTGLFYGAWRLILAPVPAVARGVTWLGGVAYAVFLLHQPFLLWTAIPFGRLPGAHLVAAVGVILLSIPAAVAIERGVGRIERAGPDLVRRHVTAFALGGGAAVATLLLVGPIVPPDGRIARALAFGVAAGVAGLAAVEWCVATRRARLRAAALGVARTGLAAGLLALFVLHLPLGPAALVIGATLAVTTTIVATWLPQPGRAWVGGMLLTAAVVIGVEAALRRWAPVEVSGAGWGERPALEVDSTRVYGLIPNRVTHLRYNNYDYVVRTNAFGLASPAISVQRPTADAFRVLLVGDAFTMPEGVSYDQSYAARLQAVLSRCMAPRVVQVINAGVTGYGPNEQGPQFHELAPLFRPDVTLYQFFINKWSDILVDADARRLNIGLTRHRPGSQILAHMALLSDAMRARVSGGLTPYRAGRLNVQYYERGESPMYAPTTQAQMARFLGHMHDDASRAGSRLLVDFVPGALTVSRRGDLPYLPRAWDLQHDSAHYDFGRPLATLLPIADSLGIPVLDLTDSLRAFHPQPVYFPTSWHWNAGGHQAATGAILGALRARNLIPSSCAP